MPTIDARNPAIKVLLSSEAPERKGLFKEWASNSLGLSPTTYDADPMIIIIKHNKLDDILDFMSLVDDDINMLRKAGPTAGDPEEELTIPEKKQIQALASFFHSNTVKHGGMLEVDHPSWTKAAYNMHRIAADISIHQFWKGDDKANRELAEFNKNIRIQVSDYNKLTTEVLFHKQSKAFLTTAEAHGMSDCFEDPDTFTPANAELDNRKQVWMYNTLIQKVEIPIARKTLNKHLPNKNCRLAWKEIVLEINENQAAQIRTGQIANFLTSCRFHKQGWKGSQQNQVLYYHQQVELYGEIAITDFTNDQKVMFTNNAVAGTPNLSGVLTTLKNAKIGATGTSFAAISVPYTQFHQSLLGAAQAFDADNNATTRTGRQVNQHEIYQSEMASEMADGFSESPSTFTDYSANVHNLDTDLDQFMEVNVNKTSNAPRDVPIKKPVIRLHVPEDVWKKMSKPLKQMWLKTPEEVKLLIVKTAVEKKVNVHEFIDQTLATREANAHVVQTEDGERLQFSANVHKLTFDRPDTSPTESFSANKTKVTDASVVPQESSKNKSTRQVRFDLDAPVPQEKMTLKQFQGLDIYSMMSQPSPGVHKMKEERLEQRLLERPKPQLEAKFHEIEINDDDESLSSADDAEYHHHGLSISMARLSQYDEQNDQTNEKKEEELPSPTISQPSRSHGPTSVAEDTIKTEALTPVESKATVNSPDLQELQPKDTSKEEHESEPVSWARRLAEKYAGVPDTTNNPQSYSLVAKPEPVPPKPEVSFAQLMRLKYASSPDTDQIPVPSTPAEEQSMIDTAMEASQVEAPRAVSYYRQLLATKFGDQDGQQNVKQEYMKKPFSHVPKPPKTIDRFQAKPDGKGWELVSQAALLKKRTMLDESTPPPKEDLIEKQSIASFSNHEDDDNSSSQSMSENGQAITSLRRNLSTELQSPDAGEATTVPASSNTNEATLTETQDIKLTTPPATVQLHTPQVEHKANPSASMTSHLPMTDDSGKDKKSYSLTVQDGLQAVSPKEENEPQSKAESPSTKSPHKKLQKLGTSSSVKDLDTKPSPKPSPAKDVGPKHPSKSTQIEDSDTKPSPKQKKKTKSKRGGLAKVVRDLAIDTGSIGGQSKFLLPDSQSGYTRGRTRRSRSSERVRTDSDGFTPVTSPSKKSVARSSSSPPPSRPSSEALHSKATKPNTWCPNPFQPLEQDDDSTLEDVLNTTFESVNEGQPTNDSDKQTDQDFQKAKRE